MISIAAVLLTLWKLISFQFPAHIPAAGIALSIAFWTAILFAVLCIKMPNWWSHAIYFGTTVFALISVLVLMDGYTPEPSGMWGNLPGAGQLLFYFGLLVIFGILLLAGIIMAMVNYNRAPAKKPA